MSRTAYRGVAGLLAAAVCLSCLGCGGSSKKIVHGTVAVGGQKPERGMIRFVPIEDTPGGTNAAMILDGEYRIDARGGLPIGKYRVEVEIYGMKRPGPAAANDDGLSGEVIPIGPPQYTGKNSPLIEEVTADSDGRIDIEIPTR